MASTRDRAVSGEINLRQLAEQMNVAVSTISRALAGDPGVSKKRATEIRRLARKVGYRPKPLRRKRTDTIGLIIATAKPGIADEVFQQTIILNVERAASEWRKHVHVEFVPRDPDTSIWPAMLSNNRVDGVLLTGHPPVSLCRRLREEACPTVVLSDTVERTGCSSAISDSTTQISEAIRRLIEMGHRTIGMAITQRQYPSVEIRRQAYVQAMQEQGLTPAPGWVLEGLTPSLAGGREAVSRYLESGTLPTAIVFINDWMAIGAIQELMARGYRVPSDVSIIGHDNITICEEMNPPLTSLDGQIEKLIHEGIELLRRQIEGDMSVVQIKVPALLVWRDSCAPPRAQG